MRTKLHVRKGDLVQVISGNFRGQRGKVLRVLTGNGRVVVEGVNLRKKHVRATPQAEGGIITFEAGIHSSNVLPVCPHCDRPVRVRRHRDAEGRMERLCVRCGKPILKA